MGLSETEGSGYDELVAELDVFTTRGVALLCHVLTDAIDRVRMVRSEAEESLVSGVVQPKRGDPDSRLQLHDNLGDLMQLFGNITSVMRVNVDNVAVVSVSRRP